MTDTTQAGGRRQFLLLAALFAAPIVAAVSLYVWPELQPTGRTNYGTLVAPVQPVPETFKLVDADGKPAEEEALHGKWSMVYVGGADCAKSCQEKLFQIRQVRALLADDRVRLRRVYIAPDAAALAALRTPEFNEIHKDLLTLADLGAPGQRAADFFKPAVPDTVYLVDPLGNWMMVYAPDSDYKKMLKDVKYLLKLSHIG